MLAPGKSGLRAETLGRHDGKPFCDELDYNPVSVKKPTPHDLKKVMFYCWGWGGVE